MPETTAVRWVALIGNPNVGKTSLFNQLTGLRQKVANYPGVTVERREGVLRGENTQRVLDLPGVGSLVARSPDEWVAAHALAGDFADTPTPDQVVVVIDATRPGRGLFLLSQVLEYGLPTIVCLNMVDEARREGVVVDAAQLGQVLALPVVETVATSREGARPLVALLEGEPKACPSPHLVAVPGLQGLPAPSAARWSRIREVCAEGDLAETEVQARWRWVNDLRRQVEIAPPRERQRSDGLDRLLLHPWMGPLVFVLVMGVLFQGVFALATAPMDAIDTAFGWLGESARSLLGDGLVADFLVDGVVAGVGGVVIFLPQILILFFLLGVLEDSGYMTRAAFLVDRPLRAVGLSGRSFIPLLSSFACAVPGILATRGVEDRRERLITIMVAPLMTCSARLPVYTLLIGAFIEDRRILGFVNLQGLVLLGLYLFGGAVAAFAALFIHRILSRGEAGHGIMELAPYRRPRARALLLRLWQRCQLFLKRAGTIILAMSIVVWALMAFPRMERPAGIDDATFRSQQLSQSVAGRLGHAIEPAIEPLGYDWRIGIGLVGSLAAREVFVSTMSVVYAVEGATDEELEQGVSAAMGRSRWDATGRPVYTLATVLSLLVFYAIALQCISTIAVVLRETRSWAWALGQFTAFTALAWLAAWVTYSVAS